MKPLAAIKAIDRLHIEMLGADGGCGMLYLNGTKAKPASVVFSWGGGWEHAERDMYEHVMRNVDMARKKRGGNKL